MNWLKRIIAKIKDYRDNPQIEQVPDAPDALGANQSQFDPQVIENQLGATDKEVKP